MKKVFLLFAAITTMLILLIVSCEQKEKKTTVAEPVSKDSLIKRGEYLVAICGCEDCHTPKKMGAMGPEPDMAIRLSGYRSDVPLPPVDTNVIKKGWALANGELTGWV